MRSAIKGCGAGAGGGAAQIVVREVCDPLAFGVAQFDNAGRLIRIVEKPIAPAPSNYAVTGIYFYDTRCEAGCSPRAGK